MPESTSGPKWKMPVKMNAHRHLERTPLVKVFFSNVQVTNMSVTNLETFTFTHKISTCILYL